VKTYNCTLPLLCERTPFSRGHPVVEIHRKVPLQPNISPGAGVKGWCIEDIPRSKILTNEEDGTVGKNQVKRQAIFSNFGKRSPKLKWSHGKWGVRIEEKPNKRKRVEREAWIINSEFSTFQGEATPDQGPNCSCHLYASHLLWSDTKR